MADNTLALLHYFTGNSSPLSSLTSSNHTPRVVYFSLLGTYFIKYSFSAASAMYTTLLVAVLAFIWETSRVTSNINFLKLQLRGQFSLLGGLVGALAGVNIVAYFMSMVLGKNLSWFSREWLPLVLYGPPAMAGATLVPKYTMPNGMIVGALVPQLLFFHPTHQDESTILCLTLLLYSLLGVVLQSVFELGSASFLFVVAIPLLLTLVMNAVQNERFEDVSLRIYAFAGIMSLVAGTEVWCGLADVFVPLMS